MDRLSPSERCTASNAKKVFNYLLLSLNLLNLLLNLNLLLSLKLLNLLLIPEEKREGAAVTEAKLPSVETAKISVLISGGFEGPFSR